MRFHAELHKKLLPHALKRAREQAGLSIEEAASRSGISELALQNHEFGTHLPAMDCFLFELQTYGLDFGRFHELLLEVYSDLIDDDISGRMNELETRLKALEEASTTAARDVQEVGGKTDVAAKSSD